MIDVKRIICLLAVAVLLVATMPGCNKMPAVNDNVKPGASFSQYDKLTALYGTPWREVLSELGIDLQELDTEGLNYVGIPVQESFAGITFDVALRFGGEDNHLVGVEYTATYQYPEDESKFLRDMVKVNRTLISDFGDPSDTSIVFNWAEKHLGEQWNRDIAYWQDVQILKRLADNDYGGTLLFWNLTTVAEEQILKVDSKHGLSSSFSIRDKDGIAVLQIGY